jgi:hypothetical protein
VRFPDRLRDGLAAPHGKLHVIDFRVMPGIIDVIESRIAFKNEGPRNQPTVNPRLKEPS